eukprot:2840779-Rhodomonas_salina.1
MGVLGVRQSPVLTLGLVLSGGRVAERVREACTRGNYVSAMFLRARYAMSGTALGLGAETARMQCAIWDRW